MSVPNEWLAPACLGIVNGAAAAAGVAVAGGGGDVAAVAAAVAAAIAAAGAPPLESPPDERGRCHGGSVPRSRRPLDALAASLWTGAALVGRRFAFDTLKPVKGEDGDRLNCFVWRVTGAPAPSYNDAYAEVQAHWLGDDALA